MGDREGSYGDDRLPGAFRPAKGDLRDRLLAEIDRGREVYEGTDLMEHRVLRALRREMGRHQKSIQGLWCSFCNSVDGRWPCPSIKEVADELGIN